MKKILVSTIVALITMHSFVQAQINSSSSVQATSKGIPTDIKQNDYDAKYRLFPTQNMWTFIKLDTKMANVTSSMGYKR